MKYLTFIVTLLSLLIASALLAIAVRSCAPNAHAEIRVEWIPLPGTEGWHVNAIETDGRRLYAATWEGGYISLDNGNTWSSTEPQHGVSAIAIDRNNLYAATFLRGVFRSDSHGVTWKPINNGIRTINGDQRRKPPTHTLSKYSLLVPASSSLWGTTAARIHPPTEARHGTT